MGQPFAGLRVIDTTHVLAGPFAAYQLAVLGADVIKVESPEEPDQARFQGSDRALNDSAMGTMFLAQASNKRSIALHLKTEEGRKILRHLVRDADIFIENYRPGAFDELGLGYETLAEINPRLIYCSVSAFGPDGPRGRQTGYDNIIQAMSGLMAMTGTPQVSPLKVGTPVIDYTTGITGAFAIASALFQRERTGRGQRIDLAMMDVAMIVMGSHITANGWNGSHPSPRGNDFPFATIGCYQAKRELIMVSAANLRQQRRLWEALDRPDMVKHNNNQRLDAYAVERTLLTEIMLTRTAEEWEEFLQARRVPAGRIRTMGEALADPQLTTRGVLHRHQPAPGLAKSFTVPLAAFKFQHGGPSIAGAPREVGADTVAVLREMSYSDADIAALRIAKAI